MGEGVSDFECLVDGAKPGRAILAADLRGSPCIARGSAFCRSRLPRCLAKVSGASQSRRTTSRRRLRRGSAGQTATSLGFQAATWSTRRGGPTNSMSTAASTCSLTFVQEGCRKASTLLTRTSSTSARLASSLRGGGPSNVQRRPMVVEVTRVESATELRTVSAFGDLCMSRLWRLGSRLRNRTMRPKRRGRRVGVFVCASKPSCFGNSRDHALKEAGC